MKETNKVLLTGIITGIRAVRSDISVRIATYGNNSSRNSASSYPNVLFRDKNKVSGFTIGDRVTIEGYISGYNIIATKIEPTKRALSKYFRDEMIDDTDGAYMDDENVVVTCGRVLEITSPVDGLAVVDAEVEDEHGKNIVHISCFRRQKDTALEFKENDLIASVSSIRTIITKENKKEIQSVTCKDIQKIS